MSQKLYLGQQLSWSCQYYLASVSPEAADADKEMRVESKMGAGN